MNIHTYKKHNGEYQLWDHVDGIVGAKYLGHFDGKFFFPVSREGLSAEELEEIAKVIRGL